MSTVDDKTAVSPILAIMYSASIDTERTDRQTDTQQCRIALFNDSFKQLHQLHDEEDISIRYHAGRRHTKSKVIIFRYVACKTVSKIV